MIDRKIHPYGDRALLVEFPDADGVLDFSHALRDADLDGVDEVVTAARTVLVRFDPARIDAAALDARITSGFGTGPSTSSPAELVELDVVYDGADLALVAASAGCDVDEVIRRHCEPTYVVAFCGFAPGFAYLTGLPVSLRQPRLPTPRTAVPDGAVGIAGEYTGVYPRSSPGGWRLLGRTDAPLWDLDRDPPALLSAGRAVRFRPT